MQMYKYQYSIFLLLFIISINNSEKNNKFLRKLKTLESKIQKICTSDNFNQKEKVTSKYENFGSYIKDEELSKNILVDLLTDKDKFVKLDFILDFIPYLLVLVLGLVFFVAWLVTLIVFSCGKCNCYEKASSRMSLIGAILYVVSTVLFVGVIICSLIGLLKSLKTRKYFQGSTCTLLTFFDNFINGYDSDLETWGGTKNISESFQRILDKMGNFSESFPSTLSKSTYISEVNNLNTTYLQVLPNRADKNDFPDGMEPNYFETIDDKLTKLYKEYANESIIPISEYLQEFEKQYTLFTNMDERRPAMEEIIRKMESLSSTIENATESLGDKIYKFEVLSQDHFSTIIIAFFGLFMSLSGIIILTLSLYVCNWLFCTRIFVNLAWNIIMFLLIFSIGIGAILGAASDLSKKIGPAMKYILSKEYLSSGDSSFGGNSEVGDFLDVCLNGDGDLSTIINFRESVQLDNLSALIGDTFETYKDIISEKKYSVIGNELETQILNNLYETNFKYITMKQKSINDMMTRINEGLTGATQVFCISSAEDSCVSPRPDILTKNCDDYNTESVADKKQYCQFIKLCEKDIKNLKSSIINYNDDYENTISKLNASMIIVEKLQNDISANVTDINNELTDLDMGMKCSFLGEDLIYFVHQFQNKFSSEAKAVSNCAIILSVFAFIGVYFVIPSLDIWFNYSKEFGGSSYCNCCGEDS